MLNMLEDSMCHMLYEEFKQTTLYIACFAGLPFERAFSIFMVTKGFTVDTAFDVINVIYNTFNDEFNGVKNAVRKMSTKPECCHSNLCTGECKKDIIKSAVFCPFDNKIEK